MCGIAGWVNWELDLRKEKEVIQTMEQCQQHRGPDESGEWFSKTTALGHRRLVVIDPEGGQQPMIGRKGLEKYVLVYNGELYNTKELRQKLKQKGYVFSGHSDTEVLLKSYLE